MLYEQYVAYNQARIADRCKMRDPAGAGTARLYSAKGGAELSLAACNKLLFAPCGGDCCCFMELFSRVSKVLALAFGLPTAELVVRRPPFFPEAMGPVPLLPILYLARGPYGLHAEAGCQLWRLADSGSDLCDGRAVDALLNMLREGSFFVQYPAAMALLGISRRPVGLAFLRAAGVAERLSCMTLDAERVVKEKVQGQKGREAKLQERSKYFADPV